MKLYAYSNLHFFLMPAQIAAAAAGVKPEFVQTTEEMNQDKDFKQKKGHGQYPMLETTDGQVLFESVAIASYFCRVGNNKSLLGVGAFQEAQVDQWTSFATASLEGDMRKIAMTCWGMKED